ncbi:membrane integrity-associated transporter subunit PqiC [Ruegeria sediminis]|uniref:Membrane integrity-associated transporter subunit PqiC n=1 Tax=Ruegeria sediminis TaxID=2583820 RepID=A0ABY2WXI1_9RHOB|nr:PqiC family protein [Ruegeria sediminis]TMV07142.1 membrane integrity-associated transporter subunit PqiC [Ruegeria sediminis]
MKTHLILLACCAVLPACASNEALYLIAPTPGEKAVRVQARTIEMRMVSLPTYAAASEIIAQTPDGALHAQGNALWADDPERGMTAALARGLGERTGASVTMEPWPLSDGPDARVDVRVDQVYARADGSFELSGQFAVSSPDGVMREFVRRFDIRTPVQGEGPAAISNALAVALSRLSSDIAVAMR